MTTGSGTGTPVTSNSYSSIGEVLAFTRHLLDGQSTFNSTTRPTASEIQKFIDRASGVLNSALASSGLDVPVTQPDAALACDDWVTARSAEYVELTQRGVGYNGGEGSRTAAFRGLYKMASEFAADQRLGFIRLGVTAGQHLSQGLQFTGLDAAHVRTDPANADLAQPAFRRGLFNIVGASSTSAEPAEGDDD